MDFYYLPGSAPCRAIMMTAKAVGVELNLKLTDLMKGEHMTPEFLKINPQHCIPTLVDDGFVLLESRAIMIYLVEKYGKYDNALYPSCPKKRAIINQRLFFDMGSLYQSFAEYHYPQVFANPKKPADPELFKKMENTVGFLNGFLEYKTYVAGDNLTLADLSILATIATYEVANFDFSKYPNVAKWYKHCNAVAPGADINKSGAEEFRKYLDSK